MLHAAALIVSLGLARPEAMAPTLTADLDGDGVAEKATASAAKGAVRLQVQSSASKKPAAATAPAPKSDVVRVALTAAPMGRAGSLLEVTASTDASECLSVWQYRDAALARVPIRDAKGRALPDCASPGAWRNRWEPGAGEAPSALIRERTERVARGKLQRREAYAFTGSALEFDRKRSASEVDGIPIPRWYDARFYTREGLDQLYKRFDLPAFRATPQLEIAADPEGGVFDLRFFAPSGEVLAPVESYAAISPDRTASLVAHSGEKTIRVRVQLAGDGTVPIEIQVDGLGPEFDTLYAPAGSWHGRGRQVYPTAADEIASQQLVGAWSGPHGSTVQIQLDGAPPYRLRVDKDVYVLDYDHPADSTDLTLRPADGSHRGWGLVLKGPNALDRIGLACDPGGGAACRADGPAERLRRMGARINVN